nr:multiheme C-type cytochrome [uncultured Desulfobulbus sp.]
MKPGTIRVHRQLSILLFFSLMPAVGTATKPEPSPHPELSAQEQYIPCAQCHQESTPELYQQWFDSRHGLAMVKCYQCHGTFETFRLTPTRQDCAVCHENMMDKCPQDKPCWDCHLPHDFTIKK